MTFAATSTFASQHTIAFLPGFGAIDVSNSAGELIEGPGANLLTISGDDAVGVFQVGNGVTASISGLTITGGSATNGGGIDNDGRLTITDSTIENSYASNNGGGIANSGTLTVTDSTIEGSNASNNGGGINNCGTLTISDSSITDNYVSHDGGGINNDGTLTVTDSTIANNSSGAGGGIENTGMLTLMNCTIAGNGVVFQGGGIDNFDTLTAVDTTIAYNTGSYYSGLGGGGLCDEPGSTALLDNTIVALNTNANSRPEDITGSVCLASAYNLIGTGGSGGLTNATSGNLVGIADPGLAAGLTNNGGPTQTIALLAGSAGHRFRQHCTGRPVWPHHRPARGRLPPDRQRNRRHRRLRAAPSFGNATVYMVNLTSDTGASSGTDSVGGTAYPSGDLLWAITQANANTNPAGSVIEFDPTVFNSSSRQTIALTSTLELSEAPGPEVIQGPGANVVTISGNHAVVVFSVGSATTATITGLTIADGRPGISNGGRSRSPAARLPTTPESLATA